MVYSIYNEILRNIPRFHEQEEKEVKSEAKSIDIRDLKALTEKDVLKIYNISHATLWRWSKTGMPRHELRHGRRTLWRYYREEINEWLETDSNARRDAQEIAKRKTRRDKYFIKYPLMGDGDEH